MTLISSANNTDSDTEIQNLFSGEGHLYILGKIEALDLILGEIHVSTYPTQKKTEMC
jgi:hypothetical protein